LVAAPEAVLRDLAARRDLPNELDLDHVAEEIEDVGRSEFNAVQSFIRLCLVHTLKAACSPRAELAPKWGEEAVRFRGDALDRLTPSMSGSINLDAIWHRAVREVEQSLSLYGEVLPPSLPVSCPFDLNSLAAASFDPRAAVDSLKSPRIGTEAEIE
jgi:Domain of unknown function DUF29